MGKPEPELTIPLSLVSVIVPAFNEEQNIPNCVQELSDVMRKAEYNSEIIIVNDGSTDKTLEVAQSMQMKCESLRVLNLGRNCGKAVALREGVRVSKGDAVAFFDADMQYNAADLIKLLDLANNGTDVVTGKRDYQSYGLTRTAFSKVYNRILKLVFRVAVDDSNCGLKVLRRGAADPDTLFDYGLALMMPLLKMRGYRLSEAWVSLRRRNAGESKYYKDGSFLGGWKNIRDISYHSGMLIALLANLPSQWLRLRDVGHTGADQTKA